MVFRVVTFAHRDVWLRRFSTRSPSVALHPKHMRITQGKDTYDFHYLWLNHNCSCTSVCIHPKTRERIRDASQISENVKPVSAFFENNQLQIKWGEHLEHNSTYSFEWLLQHAYAKNHVIVDPTGQDGVGHNGESHESVGSGSVKPPSNDIGLLEIDFKQINDQSKSKKEAMKTYKNECYLRLSSYGAVLTRNRGLDTEEIIHDFLPEGHDVIHSHFGRYEDLKTDNTTNKNTDQLGYTNSAVYPHTDQPFIENPPGLQMLHCLQPASSGGENALVDAKQAALYLKSIDPHAFKLLTTCPVKFHRKQANFESVTRYPLISMTGDKFQIRYSYFTYAPFNFPFELMEDWYRAYNKFANIVRNRKYQYYFLLNSGDYLLYNNFTMLHAREEFKGNRHLRGIYYDHNTVTKKLTEDSQKK